MSTSSRTHVVLAVGSVHPVTAWAEAVAGSLSRAHPLLVWRGVHEWARRWCGSGTEPLGEGAVRASRTALRRWWEQVFV